MRSYIPYSSVSQLLWSVDPGGSEAMTGVRWRWLFSCRI